MSLLDEQMEDFVLLEKTRVPDGYGGLITKWVDGETIQAATALDDSTEARIGVLSGITDVYTIITSKAITLEYHDVLRRVRDGRIFRVTTDGTDKKTPRSAGLNMRNVRAEEWKLPASSGGE